MRKKRWGHQQGVDVEVTFSLLALDRSSGVSEGVFEAVRRSLRGARGPGGQMSCDAHPQHEDNELAREVLEAAEQAHILAGYSVEALSRLITASRRFQRALDAGDPADPAPLLLAFGGASSLLHRLQQRFDVGSQALAELRFGVESQLHLDAR